MKKSIMVAILGRPNAGKSSLINHLLGFDLSVVTHKAQTTRNQFHCCMNIDQTEIVFVDTPGIHFANQEMNKRMNEEAMRGAKGADLNLYLVDLTSPVLEEIKKFRDAYKGNLNKTWVVFTKSDLAKFEASDELKEQIKELFPEVENFFSVSSKTGDNIHLLTGGLCDEAKPGFHLYPDGDVSNKPERFFVSEYIREQVFKCLNEELPYEIAVTIEEFKDWRKYDETDLEDVRVRVQAMILVNRPSQRAIVVGKGGSQIKRIGERARKKIETMLGCKVFLKMHVKVSPKWFSNNFVLEELGLPRALNSKRVWRKN